jgi:hypothetical protein
MMPWETSRPERSSSHLAFPCGAFKLSFITIAMNDEINLGIPYRPKVRPRSHGPEETAPSATEADVERFLLLSAAEQGRILGAIRGNSSVSTVTPVYRTKAFARFVRERLEALEDDANAFAEFQSAYIKAAVGLVDDSKVARMHEIIEAVYAQAVTHGLQASARPSRPDDVEAWALRRDALDRPATRQVQALLTPEERTKFGNLFLGIMGIDLGRGDGARHRFVLPEGGVVFPSELA